jgi:hypothetical protein
MPKDTDRGTPELSLAIQSDRLPFNLFGGIA